MPRIPHAKADVLVNVRLCLICTILLASCMLKAQTERSGYPGSVRQRHVGPVRIIAGQSSTLAWPAQNGPVAFTSVETSPPLPFPPQVDAYAAAPDIRVRLRVQPGTPAGIYNIRVIGTDSAGAFDTTAELTVAAPTLPRATAGKNPVILLNGFQLVCFNSDSTVDASVDTFGQLASLLQADGVPVGFFNNCSYGDVSIESLAAQLRTFITNLIYSDGTPVTGQIDLVAHSMGGLIARTYLAGLREDGSLAPPPDPQIRKLVLIATPNFGSFQAPSVGIQAPEMVPGSTFLWALATWNQNQDDLRGVDAMAIVGNAGNYYAGTNADDGVVSLSSASLNFARLDQRTRVVPYCHITPGFSTAFGTVGMVCSGQQGIADIDSPSHLTAQAVRSFLAYTPAWTTVGSPPTQDPVLSKYGGVYFALENADGTQYYNDLTQVSWGSVTLNNGGASGAVYYNEFIRGTGTFQFTSSSQGTNTCGSYTPFAGEYITYRCKYGPIITSVSPLLPNASALEVRSGATVTVSGSSFGYQCPTCQVVAYPQSIALTINTWTDQNITVALPASLSGLVQLVVSASGGSDAINVMIAAATPAANPFQSHLLDIEGSMTLDGQPTQYECFISYFTQSSGLAVFGTVGSEATLQLSFEQQVTFNSNTVTFNGVTGTYYPAGSIFPQNVFFGTLNLTVTSANIGSSVTGTLTFTAGNVTRQIPLTGTVVDN